MVWAWIGVGVVILAWARAARVDSDRFMAEKESAICMFGFLFQAGV